MQCIRCGKEMVITTGGNYYCQSCNTVVNDLVYRPSNCDIPMPQGFGEQKGWICPVCGRGVAPWVDVCPCQKDAGVINVTTTTEPVITSLSEYAKILNEGIETPEAYL